MGGAISTSDIKTGTKGIGASQISHGSKGAVTTDKLKDSKTKTGRRESKIPLSIDKNSTGELCESSQDLEEDEIETDVGKGGLNQASLFARKEQDAATKATLLSGNNIGTNNREDRLMEASQYRYEQKDGEYLGDNQLLDDRLDAAEYGLAVRSTWAVSCEEMMKQAAVLYSMSPLCESTTPGINKGISGLVELSI